MPLPRRHSLIGHYAMPYRLSDQASVGCHQWFSYLLRIQRFIIPSCFTSQVNRRFLTNAIQFFARRSSAVQENPCADKHAFPSFGQGIRLIFVMLLVLAVSACGSLKVNISTEVPHRDAEKKPLPVTVRLYQLSSKDKFQKADFLSLLKDDEKLLGTDKLWKEQITLFPNTEMTKQVERQKGAKYFAVVALFRGKSPVFRQVVDLDELWFLSVNVKVQEGTVTFK